MISRVLRHFFPTHKALSADEKRQALNSRFFSSSFHQWIISEKSIKRSFEYLFTLLPEELLDFFLEKELAFVRASGKLSCALSSLHEVRIVVVFPDLHKLLKSASPLHGIAVLAHELGHLYFDHGNQSINQLQAQIEADAFACHLGLSDELKNMLSDYSESEECQIRIEYINKISLNNRKEQRPKVKVSPQLTL